MKEKRTYSSHRELEKEIERRSREDFLNGIKRMYQVTGTLFIKELFDDVLDEFSKDKLNQRCK